MGLIQSLIGLVGAYQRSGSSGGYSTRKFVAWGSKPRPGRRVVSVTLGYHYKRFGSARTARAPCVLELAAQGSGLSAAGRTNWGRRLGGRSIHDRVQIRIKTA